MTSNQFDQALQKVINNIKNSVETALIRASESGLISTDRRSLNQLLFLIDETIVTTHKSSKKSYDKKVKSVLDKLEHVKQNKSK